MKLNKLKNLNRQQYGWIIRAYFHLWLVKFRLKFSSSDWLAARLSFADAAALSDQKHENYVDDDPSMNIAKLLHESVRIAARLHFGRTDCLPRSLTLLDMLNQIGGPAELKIGIARDREGAFASHAWVELSGAMVAEPESVGQQFTPVARPNNAR